MPRLPAIAVPPMTVPIIRSGKVFAREHRVERHDARVDEAEHGRDGVELAQVPGENIGERADRLRKQAETRTRLAPNRSPSKPKPIRPPMPASPSTL